MALPKIETPTYNMVVPSTQEEIKFRPFLVREEKILLLAMEEDNNKATHDAVLNLVDSCTFGKIGKRTDPMFDIEYTFLKIRSKSVSETVDLNILCPDDGVTYVPHSIEIDSIDVLLDDEYTQLVDVGNNVKVQLRFPNIGDSLKANDIESETERVFFVVKSCIEEIHFGDDIYHKADITNKELDEFIDNLSQNMFEDLQKFFERMPKLRHVFEVENPKTGIKSEITLEGLADFLG